jgi:putative transposase
MGPWIPAVFTGLSLPLAHPMANTYTALHYHLVFSTKHRERWITPDIEQRVWAYLGGIAKENRMKPLQIGGVEDHVHVLLGAPATLAPSKIAQLIKGGSSGWVHHTFPALRAFAWQDGYGAFTVSQSHVADVIAYIQGQRVHHHARTFQQEYLALLRKHGIEYDERYVWD